MKKTEIIAYLNNYFAQKRTFASVKAEQNLQKMQNDKNFTEVDGKIRILTAQIGKAKAFDENKKTVQTLENQLKELKESRKEILKKNNLFEEDITPTYSCKKCNDTGRVNGKVCDCYKKEYYNLLLQNSNISTKLSNFEEFNSEIASNPTQKETLIKCKTFLKNYVSSYPKVDKHTIVFSGKTGVGKTFLASATANEFLKRGSLTLFISAFNLNNNFLQYHTTFSADKSSYYEMLSEPDVLIIDDLGTEPILKNVTINYLCALLSDRLNDGKVTIITTNFGPAEILDRYGERIFSRIFNKKDSKIIKIDGDDLRTKIKK